MERFEVRGPLAAALGVYCTAGGHYVVASASSLGSRTRLQAAAVSVNIQPARSSPRWRVLASPPVVGDGLFRYQKAIGAIYRAV